MGPDPAEVPAVKSLEAEYSKPYLAHAALAPSCAVALERDGELVIWTHSQGVFPLRSSVAQVVGLPEERIRAIHMDGAGCFGHNGADDAACDAAVLARALPGRPVRVLWSREDELRWAPFRCRYEPAPTRRPRWRGAHRALASRAVVEHPQHPTGTPAKLHRGLASSLAGAVPGRGQPPTAFRWRRSQCGTAL